MTKLRIRLYGYWRSSSSYRVRIGLALKAIDYELVPVHLLRDGGEQHGERFAELSPLRQVPLLEVEGDTGRFVLTQSMAILEYLDELVPTPALLPATAELRARARELAEMVNSGIQPFHNSKTLADLSALGVDAKAVARSAIGSGLAALEQRASESAGRFMVGDEPSLADVYLVPALYAARRFGVELESFLTLVRVEGECNGLACFRDAHPDAQPDRDPAA